MVWLSGLTFLVSAATYKIQGVTYTSTQQTVVLAAADGSNPRIDVIFVDTALLADDVTGTPAASPSEANIDPTTQLQLSFVLVAAGATTPTVSTRLVYAENAGAAAEFNWTSSSGTIVLNATSNPRSGTVNIDGTAVVSNAYIEGTIGSGSVNPFSFDHFVFYCQPKASWPNSRAFSVRMYVGTVATGVAVTVSNGTFGFESTLTGVYQQVAIPLTLFALPAGTLLTRVRITRVGSSTNGWYLDDMSFVLSNAPVVGGITQAQADALYAPAISAAQETILKTRQITLVVDGGGSTITTGAKKVYISVPYAGTITAARLLAAESGSIVLDIWKDTYAAFPPTVADTITAAAKPTLSGAQKAETTLTGWTTSVAAGDVLEINVDSVTTITKVTLTLTLVLP